MRDKKKMYACTNRYKQKHFKRIPVELRKEYYYAVLVPAAEEANESMGGYLKKALQMRIGLSDEEVEKKIEAWKAVQEQEEDE